MDKAKRLIWTILLLLILPIVNAGTDIFIYNYTNSCTAFNITTRGGTDCSCTTRGMVCGSGQSGILTGRPNNAPPLLNSTTNSNNFTLILHDMELFSAASQGLFRLRNNNGTGTDGNELTYTFSNDATANEHQFCDGDNLGCTVDYMIGTHNRTAIITFWENSTASMWENASQLKEVNVKQGSNWGNGSNMEFIPGANSGIKLSAIQMCNGTYPCTALASADITLPIVNMTFNNTNPKRYDMLNISANCTDETGLSTLNFTINKTIGILQINYTLSGVTTQISNATNVSDSRSNVWNVTSYCTDTSSNVKQNSTLLTIANTAPNQPTIFNDSDKNWKTNLTINITWTNDTDGDALNFVWFMDSKNPPTSVVQNSTSTSFTTNWTNETIWFINVTAFDLFDNSQSSATWNGTLDAATPVWQESFVANGSLYRLSTNITYNCTDKNIFETNITTYRNANSNSIFSSVNFTNITPRTSREINLTIDVSIGDKTINVTRWCGDTKNKKRKMSDWNAGKSENNRTLQFNHTPTNLQCNISYGTTNPAEKKLMPLTANVSLKMSITYKDDDYYKIAYDVVAPNAGFVSATEFICNQKIIQVYDDLAGHLLMGDGREKLSYDAQDLIDAGFTVDTKISDDNTFIQVIKKSGIIEGAVVSYDPRADNLNIAEDSAIIIIDTTKPDFSSRTPINNSNLSVSALQLNITINDTNPLTAVLFGNFSGTYARNISSNYTGKTNISFNVTLSDGFYIWNVAANDSAGNENATENFTLKIDTIAPEIDILLPINNTAFEHKPNDQITFSFNASERSKCSLVFNNVLIIANDTAFIEPYEKIVSIGFSGGIFDYFVNCTDSSGNKANTTHKIGLNLITSSSGAAGGGLSGGGGGSMTITPTQQLNSTNSSNSTGISIATISIENATHVKVTYINQSSELIQLWEELTFDNEFLNMTIPLPNFMQIEFVQSNPKTIHALKYWIDMEYISKESLSTSIRIIGIKILTLIALSSLTLIYFVIKKLRK